jgi:dephospho-CoA kinase
MLDRRAIGKIVFANASERVALESMVFSYIGQRCHEEIANALKHPSTRFVVLDAAVMLEAGWNNEVDRIVYVSAPGELRLARLATRSGWSAADLAARESAQWPESMKQSRAAAVIINDSTHDALQSQVDALLKAWGLLPSEDVTEKRY